MGKTKILIEKHGLVPFCPPQTSHFNHSNYMKFDRYFKGHLM